MGLLMVSMCMLFLLTFSSAKRDFFRERWNLFPRVTYPVITFDCAKIPNVCANMYNAVHNKGQPTTLKRITDKSRIDKNRRDSGCTKMVKPPGLSCDEYPFASTEEGGAGATTLLVPLNENKSQGGQLKKFYTQNNIGDGDYFVVNI